MYAINVKCVIAFVARSRRLWWWSELLWERVTPEALMLDFPFCLHHSRSLLFISTVLREMTFERDTDKHLSRWAAVPGLCLDRSFSPQRTRWQFISSSALNVTQTKIWGCKCYSALLAKPCVPTKADTVSDPPSVVMTSEPHHVILRQVY